MDKNEKTMKGFDHRLELRITQTKAAFSRNQIDSKLHMVLHDNDNVDWYAVPERGVVFNGAGCRELVRYIRRQYKELTGEELIADD